MIVIKARKSKKSLQNNELKLNFQKKKDIVFNSILNTRYLSKFHVILKSETFLIKTSPMEEILRRM